MTLENSQWLRRQEGITPERPHTEAPSAGLPCRLPGAGPPSAQSPLLLAGLAVPVAPGTATCPTPSDERLLQGGWAGLAVSEGTWSWSPGAASSDSSGPGRHLGQPRSSASPCPPQEHGQPQTPLLAQTPTQGEDGRCAVAARGGHEAQDLQRHGALPRPDCGQSGPRCVHVPRTVPLGGRGACVRTGGLSPESRSATTQPPLPSAL